MQIMKRWVLVGMLVLLAGCGTATPSASTSGEGSTQGSSQAPATAAAGDGAEVAESPEAAGAAENEPVTTVRKQYSAAPEQVIDPSKTYIATIETTKGTMTAELYAQDAPITVNNFVVLARDGFYNGVRFHRIVSGFMVQTGDPQGTGTGGPGYSFEDEPVTRDYLRGTLAMANSGPDTNGSQFFIVHQDTQLDKKYTIFGKVTEGLETLDAIASVPVTTNPMTGENSQPQEEVTITGVSIEEQ